MGSIFKDVTNQLWQEAANLTAAAREVLDPSRSADQVPHPEQSAPSPAPEADVEEERPSTGFAGWKSVKEINPYMRQAEPEPEPSEPDLDLRFC